ncbi:MAG TPA: hypothetical protein VF601_11320 [Beijerinckiaceae bacterium]|jgi:hypothetical protein
MGRLPGRNLLLCVCAASAAVLAGCSGDTNYVRDGFVAVGVGAERKKAADFVEGSRPAAIDYTPVGVAPPKRAVAAKHPGAVKGGEAEMDALRAANEARASEAKAAGAAVEAPKPPVVR